MDGRPLLQVLVASTRPGRAGPAVGAWFAEEARQHGAFEVELVDLAEVGLPLLDEPKHPRLRDYQHEHTKRWSQSVAAADAYAFVSPEYNYGPTPALLNALNYVYAEWNYKACGFVSYGGLSGGLRAVQLTKQVVTTLKMMPVVEGVAVPMVATLLDESKAFKSNDLIDTSATQMLDELHKWATALKTMRGGGPA